MNLRLASFVAVTISVTVLQMSTSLAEPPPLPEDPAAKQLLEEMLAAYAATEAYQSKVTFSMNIQQGRWHTVRSTDLSVAFDRIQKRMAIDMPDVLVVNDGANLWMRFAGQPGQHVKLEAPETFDLDSAVQVLPLLKDQLPPDLVLLMNGDWDGALGASGLRSVEPDPDDPDQKPGLRFKTELGTMTLWLDPDSRLVAQGQVDIDSKHHGQDEAAFTLRYQIEPAGDNEAVDEQTFAFDTTDSQEFDSFEKFQHAMYANAAGAAPAAEASSSLEGQDAPPIELQTLEGEAFKLAEQDAQVVVLDFWATWCGPCRRGLPLLQKFHDWTQENDKPVAVYALNLREESDAVRAFWEKENLTVPVLMDTEGAVGEAYQVQGIPQTVVISGGKVVHVHVGFSPELDETLKTQVDALLAEAAVTQ